MLVAEGAVDLAAEPELSLWDLAALAPDRHRGRWAVHRTGRRRRRALQGNAAASNGLLHDALLAAIGWHSGQQQAAVAELVPEVALGQRRGVGRVDQLGPGHRLAAAPGATRPARASP